MSGIPTKSSSPHHGSSLGVGVFSCPFAQKVLFSTLSFAVASFVYARYIRTLTSPRQSGKNMSASADEQTTTTTENDKKKKKYQVVFVLGGPGSGKGTQCELLTKNYPTWSHLSAGDLLRAERKKSNSELGELINARIAAGQIVPSEITVRLLRNAMEEDPSNKSSFVIDGFPRSEGNMTAWETQMDTIAKLEFVLYLDCPEEIMTSRLLERGRTSGRTDDNLDTIRKRFETAKNESMPIVKVYEQRGLLRTVRSDRSVDDIYTEIAKLFDAL